MFRFRGVVRIQWSGMDAGRFIVADVSDVVKYIGGPRCPYRFVLGGEATPSDSVDR